MDALEFLDTAIRLSASGREADKRSAVSRAYYGVFHLSIQFIEDAGIALSASGVVHEKVGWLLTSGNYPASTDASRLLNSLRKERNRADYDLNDVRFEDSSVVRTQIIAAQNVVSALAACDAEPIRSQIHDHMRAYAKNTLRLIVVERGESEA